MGCGYGFAKFLMTSTLNLFFANGVEIVNSENIPKDGALILVGNHQNQVSRFVMLSCPWGREGARLRACAPAAQGVRRVPLLL